MNKFVFIGRISSEIDFGRGNGSDYAKFGVAVDRKFKKDGKSIADFFNIVAFGNDAKYLKTYAVKGGRIVVEGRVETSIYETEQGKRTAISFISENIQILDFKPREKNQEIQTNEEITTIPSTESISNI